MSTASLGRAIGFVDENVAAFSRKGEIYLYAPDHPAVFRPAVGVPSTLEPSATNTLGPDASSAELLRPADPSGVDPVRSGERWRPNRFPRGMEVPSLVATLLNDGSTMPPAASGGRGGAGEGADAGR